MEEPFWYYATIGIVIVVVLCGLLTTAIGEASDDLPESSLDP